MSIKDLLEQSGGKSASFDVIGQSCTGDVIASETRQSTSFTTGELEFWDDGSKKLQAAITLQTEERDPLDPEDKGVRTVYVKWWGESRKALIAAVRAAGDEDVRPGGKFTVTYVDTIAPKQKGLSATKVYAYQYVPPGTGLAMTAPATQQTPGYEAYKATTGQEASVPPPAPTQPNPLVQQAAQVQQQAAAAYQAAVPAPPAGIPAPPAATIPAPPAGIPAPPAGIPAPPAPPVPAGPTPEQLAEQAKQEAAAALIANVKAYAGAGWQVADLATQFGQPEPVIQAILAS